MPADRVVLITGATGGLGRVAAATFAATGAKVGLVGRDRGRLEALAADLHLAANAWAAAEADLRDADGAARAVAAIAARFGRIDVVLHLVGGWSGGTKVAELDPAEMRAMLDQHVWTTFNVARAVVPGMIERGWGRLIAISSTVALEGTSGMAAYAVAKAGEEALLRTLARGRRHGRDRQRPRRSQDRHRARARHRPEPEERDVGHARGARRGDGLPVLGRGIRRQRHADPAHGSRLMPAAVSLGRTGPTRPSSRARTTRGPST